MNASIAENAVRVIGWIGGKLAFAFPFGKRSQNVEDIDSAPPERASLARATGDGRSARLVAAIDHLTAAFTG